MCSKKKTAIAYCMVAAAEAGRQLLCDTFFSSLLCAQAWVKCCVVVIISWQAWTMPHCKHCMIASTLCCTNDTALFLLPIKYQCPRGSCYIRRPRTKKKEKQKRKQSLSSSTNGGEGKRNSVWWRGIQKHTANQLQLLVISLFRN